jgi:hypothetical protein
MFAKTTLALAIVLGASCAAFAQEAPNPNDRHPGPVLMAPQHAATAWQGAGATSGFTAAERAAFWRASMPSAM